MVAIFHWRLDEELSGMVIFKRALPEKKRHLLKARSSSVILWLCSWCGLEDNTDVFVGHEKDKSPLIESHWLAIKVYFLAEIEETWQVRRDMLLCTSGLSRFHCPSLNKFWLKLLCKHPDWTLRQWRKLQADCSDVQLNQSKRGQSRMFGQHRKIVLKLFTQAWTMLF